MRHSSHSARRRTKWQRMTASPTGWRGSPLAHWLLGSGLLIMALRGIFIGEMPASRNNPADVSTFAEEPGVFFFSIAFFLIWGVLALWRGSYLWHRNAKHEQRDR